MNRSMSLRAQPLPAAGTSGRFNGRNDHQARSSSVIFDSLDFDAVLGTACPWSGQGAPILIQRSRVWI